MTRLVRSLVAFTLVAALSGVAPRPAGAFCLFNCSYTKTKYPIVLAHGLVGFDQLFGVFDYWFGIPDALDRRRRDGLRDPGERGELLGRARRAADRAGRADRRDHRHAEGEPDRPQPGRARRALRRGACGRTSSHRSARSAAPHKGAELADFLRANVQGGSFTQAAVAALGNFLGTRCSGCSPGTAIPQDAVAALAQLTTAGTATFNARYPQRRADDVVRLRRRERERHALLLVERHRRADERARHLRSAAGAHVASSTTRRTTAWSAGAARTSAR